MSKIKLKHSSGNSMSIAAPATNPASDLELKLPATVGNAGENLKVDGSGNLSFGNAYQFSSWYVTADWTPTAGEAVIPNWAVSNADGYEGLGTAPTYSSGNWTMPSTGYWRVQLDVIYFHSSATNDSGSFHLRHSTDSGSNFNAFATTGFRIDGGLPSNVKFCWTVVGTFKVANASNSRLQTYGTGLDTSVGRVMGGTQAGADEGYCSSLHIEKMRDL